MSMEKPFFKAKKVEVVTLYNYENQNRRTVTLTEASYFSSGIMGKHESKVKFFPWQFVAEVTVDSE